MNEQQCLEKMVPPGKERAGKMRGGIIQIMITRACNLACYHCTQNSQLGGKPVMITVDQFEQACQSLKGYWGVVGIFGGNPCMHPKFGEICEVLRSYFPFEQRGLWSNHMRGKGDICRQTFNPVTSNLNVHMDREAWNEFKRDWPEARPFGLDTDSRHSPCFVSMRDVLKEECSLCCNGRVDNSEELGVSVCPACNGTGYLYDESKAWELISNCDINQHWSALLGVFRGELRGYFCEIAYAQAILHEHEKDYPDTGLKVKNGYFEWYKESGVWTYQSEGIIHNTRGISWWELPMETFVYQVRQHCHNCSVPLRGFGQLAMAPDGREQVSKAHFENYTPKVKDRMVELVITSEQLGDTLKSTIDYMGNAKRPVGDVIQ